MKGPEVWQPSVPFDWFMGWVERAEADDFLILSYIAGGSQFHPKIALHAFTLISLQCSLETKGSLDKKMVSGAVTYDWRVVEMA